MGLLGTSAEMGRKFNEPIGDKNGGIEMEEESVSPQIPKDLYEKISQRIDGTEFKSVPEYVIFVLEEVVSEEEKEIYDEEQEEEIEERLRGLGYL